jgi:hypothetical protein
MSQAKEASPRKRRRKAVPVLGAAGLSLSLAGGAQAVTHNATVDAASLASTASHEIALCDEEVADISLATFHIFDKENAPRARVAFGGGCCVGSGLYTQPSQQPSYGGPSQSYGRSAPAPRPRVAKPVQPYVPPPRHREVIVTPQATPSTPAVDKSAPSGTPSTPTSAPTTPQTPKSQPDTGTTTTASQTNDKSTQQQQPPTQQQQPPTLDPAVSQSAGQQGESDAAGPMLTNSPN